jgi:hypothetical protein
MLHKQLIYPSRDRSSLSHFEVQSVDDIDMVDPVAVGDDVLFSDALNDEGLITEVLPRRSKLTRRASGEKPLEQVIVANVDQIVAVTAAAQPAPKWNMMDRYLAGAEASNVPMVICITKLDLVRGKKQDPLLHRGHAVDLPNAPPGPAPRPRRRRRLTRESSARAEPPVRSTPCQHSSGKDVSTNEGVVFGRER